MAYKIIPLNTDPNQSFECTLPVGEENLSFIFKVVYNEKGKYWFFSISDANTLEMILDSIPLVAADTYGIDILEQYEYLKIGSAYVMKVSQVEADYPDAVNLGTDFVLVWGDTND